jgi:hypothetical protein
MNRPGLLSRLKQWFRGLPAVPDNVIDGPWALDGVPTHGNMNDDDAQAFEIAAVEQREWLELVASVRSGARWGDDAAAGQRAQRRNRRRSGARRAAGR